MSYTLLIGDYAYSSWSLRGWLLLRRFNLPTTIRMVPFHNKDVAAQMAKHAPSRTVPTLLLDEETPVWDSLAIAEELASRHPDAGLWPSAPNLRALARTLASEMHSGFMTLRNDCPMNLRTAYQDMPISDALQADLSRIDQIWGYALEKSGGPWLCGEYSAADAFFAPVAARIAGYGLPVSPQSQTYVDAHLNDPAFRRWRAMGLVHGEHLPWYDRTYTQKDWPGPKPRPAFATDSGTPENDACPYSGKAPTHLLTLNNRTFGFCNPFCRDKTVADPEAWPEFMALL